MTTSKIKLSILVPTRERHDTLEATIKTLVTQDFTSAEFIICDNASTERTAQVVKSFNDKRIKYVRSEDRLSMSENWNYVLQYAQGEYITFIGDDDGLTPNALSVASSIIDLTETDALVWIKAPYYWPNYPDSSLASQIGVPTPTNQLITQINTQQALMQLLDSPSYSGYTRLPCLYNSFVKREILSKVMRKSSKQKFFHSICPDVFSSIVLGACLDKHLLLKYPVSINGASHHSNGCSHLRGEQTMIGSPAHKFSLENSAMQYLSEVDAINDPITKSVVGEYINALHYFPILFHSAIPEWFSAGKTNEIFYSKFYPIKRDKIFELKNKLRLHVPLIFDIYKTIKALTKKGILFPDSQSKVKSDNDGFSYTQIYLNPNKVKEVYEASKFLDFFLEPDSIIRYCKEKIKTH